MVATHRRRRRILSYLFLIAIDLHQQLVNAQEPRDRKQKESRLFSASHKGGGHKCLADGERCLFLLNDNCCDELICLNKRCQKDPACNIIHGPVASSENTVMRFLAFGDTPYDEDAGFPFVGSEYACLRDTTLPNVISSYASQADFIAHVGDIKRGGSDNSAFCNDEFYTNRYDLFAALEPSIDLFMVPGDNEWNECDGYNNDVGVNDEAKTRWREHFSEGIFANFDRATLPSGIPVPTVSRDGDNSQMFSFFMERIAFIGITEPEGDTAYDTVNANWISSTLGGEALDAIVIFGHESPSGQVLNALDNYKDVPTLYVTGNEHQFCSKFLDRGRFPDLVEVTVAAYLSEPLLISIVTEEQQESSPKATFHIDRPEQICQGGRREL